MADAFPWLAVGALASGVASLVFLHFLWPYRDAHGGRFFIGAILCEALWSLSYGCALFVFDPALRWLFEIPIWAAINFIGVFFLAFALEYTGRSSLLRSRWMSGVVALQTVHTLVVATNPFHHVAWRNYHIEPTFGLATVTYTHDPWLFVNAAGVILMIAAGSFLLADTVFSYGPLYRTQAAAIALSPVFPGLPFLLWLAQVGASPPVNLTPLALSIHLVFDAYAFFSRNMFDMVPAARRAAERAAVEDLGSAVVIVDEDRRIIETNNEARRVLGADRRSALGSRLDDYLAGVDPSGSGETIALTTTGRRREYAVTTSPLEDPSGSRVGHTVVLQDITAERRREQRLSVLNRVLRHNLRNDLNVVQGVLGIARDRVDDEELRDHLATAETKTSDVVEVGEKARDVERVMATDEGDLTPVSLRDVLDGVRADLASVHPEGRIRIDVPADLRLRASEPLLDRVFRNLVENALEHTDADDPAVEVVATRSGGTVTVTVRDDGPGIPDHELDVLESSEETALEHGSGLGLWVVTWGVRLLGGTVSFETDGEGSTVVLELPAAGTGDDDAMVDGIADDDAMVGDIAADGEGDE